MRLSEFPNCCTMKVIAGVEKGLHNGMMGSDCAQDADSLESYIMATMGFGKHDEVNDYKVAELANQAAIVISTNLSQKFAIEVLKKLDFMSSDWMYKKSHPKEPVKIWWMHIDTAKKLWADRELVGKANVKPKPRAKRTTGVKKIAKKQSGMSEPRVSPD